MATVYGHRSITVRLSKVLKLKDSIECLSGRQELVPQLQLWHHINKNEPGNIQR